MQKVIIYNSRDYVAVKVGLSIFDARNCIWEYAA